MLATLFDFRRAFDSIDHEALLPESRNMKFSPDAIKWVHSYISGRTQAVICQDEQSDFLPVICSSAGPIFFSILINSLPRCLKYCKFSYIPFADDLQLFIQCPVNLISSAVSHMTEEANNVSRCASEYGLQLIPGKTNLQSSAVLQISHFWQLSNYHQLSSITITLNTSVRSKTWV